MLCTWLGGAGLTMCGQDRELSYLWQKGVGLRPVAGGEVKGEWSPRCAALRSAPRATCSQSPAAQKLHSPDGHYRQKGQAGSS